MSIDFERNDRRFRLRTVKLNAYGERTDTEHDTTATEISRALEMNNSLLAAVAPTIGVSSAQADNDHLLATMHQLVAELCVKLGDDPAEVPCDIWRLHEHIEHLQRDLRSLAESWDRVGRGARDGWNEQRLERTDAARDRVLYPGRRP